MRRRIRHDDQQRPETVPAVALPRAITRPAADLPRAIAVALARESGLDYRTVAREWREPGSVTGQAGVRARIAIAMLLAAREDAAT